MKTIIRCTILLCLAILVAPVSAQDQQPKADDGFVSIFDGKTLKGWDGDPKLWPRIRSRSTRSSSGTATFPTSN